jgi:hypothetical protein
MAEFHAHGDAVMGRTVNPSGQLDLVEQLTEQAGRAEDILSDLGGSLNLEIDANPKDKLLMEMLDVVSDAQESLAELRELLLTMERRDREEEGG